jgi:hypothetical protein
MGSLKESRGLKIDEWGWLEVLLQQAKSHHECLIKLLEINKL